MPRARSRRTKLERPGPQQQLLFQIRATKLPEPEWEYRFHPTRRWRADMAYPQLQLLIEVHGGVWTRGRHVQPMGFTKDCEKYTAAASMGYLIFHFTATDVRRGTAINVLEEYLKRRSVVYKQPELFIGH